MFSLSMRQAVNVLEAIRDGDFKTASRITGYDVTKLGLCASVFTSIFDDDHILSVRIRRSLFRQWEHFSGCASYPVPNTYGMLEHLGKGQHAEAFELSCDRANFFPPSRYGELRKDLAGFMAYKLREMFLND